MNLKDYCFPVTERPVCIYDGKNKKIDLDDRQTFLPADYKSIIREDTNEVISIVRNSYTLIKNEEIINQLLRQLAQINTPFLLHESHSFVQNNRMRLQITFPKIYLNDSKSEIPLSLYLHNSYDMSEGVRFFWGFLRLVCKNGLIAGKLMDSFYSKHTSGFRMDDLGEQLDRVSDFLPTIQHRIDELQILPVTPQLEEAVQTHLGKRLAKQVLDQEQEIKESQWDLLNKCTHIISHDLDQPLRFRYQKAVSQVFGI